MLLNVCSKVFRINCLKEEIKMDYHTYLILIAKNSLFPKAINVILVYKQYYGNTVASSDNTRKILPLTLECLHDIIVPT